MRQVKRQKLLAVSSPNPKRRVRFSRPEKKAAAFLAHSILKYSIGEITHPFLAKFKKPILVMRGGRVVKIEGYTAGICKAVYEGRVGIFLRKGGIGFGIARLGFLKDTEGKKFVSIEAIDPFPRELGGSSARERMSLQQEFESETGLQWNEFLAQKVLDTAYEAGYDGIALARAEKQISVKVFFETLKSLKKYKSSKREAERRILTKIVDGLRNVYDGTAGKVGIRKKAGKYWVLYFP